MLTGGFGPFSRADLTGLLGALVASDHRRMLSATLHDVQYRAGHYYVIAEVSAHHDGGVGQFYYGLTTAPVPSEARGYATKLHDYNIFAWEHPHDPLLPGLTLAATPAQVQQYFAPDRELTALHTVIYRPMNRAVFKAHLAPQTPAGLGDTLYLKVLRPGIAQTLYNIHLTLGAAGVPVVPPIAPPVADVLTLAGGQGMPLGELARTEGVINRFDARQLIETLDRFPREILHYPHRASWADRYQEFIQSAHQAMPEEYARLGQLAYRFDQAHQQLDLGPIVPTHGDLYEAHILVDPVTGEIRQILDVDGAGPGYRVDDYACLIGHVAVLGYAQNPQWGWQTAMRFFGQLAPYTNPHTLAVRSAAVVVSLIPGYQPDEQTRARGQRYLRVVEALLELA